MTMNKTEQAWIYMKVKCHDLGRPFLTFFEIENILEKQNLTFDRLDNVLKSMEQKGMINIKDEDIKLGLRLRCYYIK